MPALNRCNQKTSLQSTGGVGYPLGDTDRALYTLMSSSVFGRRGEIAKFGIYAVEK